MKKTDYKKMYEKIFKILGDLTPLRIDCGQLCEGACCKGDDETGMLLFPHEESDLEIRYTAADERLAICDGTCDRSKRPLSCRIFPFFPTIDDKGKVYVELDYRGRFICPMIEHYDKMNFNPAFLKAVKKVGKILVKDEECREFLHMRTGEIDFYHDVIIKD
ncbi:MAG: hypothetical protein IJM97_06110 [Clostridia bacterium]|nr:hypothetical protein [Clostridia bacterium]